MSLFSYEKFCLSRFWTSDSILNSSQLKDLLLSNSSLSLVRLGVDFVLPLSQEEEEQQQQQQQQEEPSSIVIQKLLGQ